MKLSRGLAPLCHPRFRLLVSGQLASNVGDAFYAVALPWYVLAHHGGPVLLGTVLAAYGVPRTLLVAIGGQASDRWRPWNVMMAADCVRAVMAALLGAAALAGPARAVFLVPVAAVLGAGEGIFLPSSFSVIPALLPGDDLQAGNALASAGTQLASLVGPALGGLVVGLAGPAPGFFVDTASFVVSAASLFGVRERATDADPQSLGPAEEPVAVGAQEEPLAIGAQAIGAQGIGAQGSGAGGPHGPTLRQLLRSERVLQVILAVSLAANLGSGGMGEVALPALARGPFGTDAAGFGAMIAALAAGSLVGTLGAGHIAGPRRPAVVASAMYLAQGVLLALVPYTGGPVSAGVALGCAGFLNGFANVLTITAFQRWAPPQALGRLMGAVLLCSFGSFPVSVAVAGFIVRDFGPAPFFPAAGGLIVFAVVAALTQKEWRDFGREEPAANYAPDATTV